MLIYSYKSIEKMDVQNCLVMQGILIKRIKERWIKSAQQAIIQDFVIRGLGVVNQ